MSLTKVTYSMINGAVLNVLDYGADPTGNTDSAAAIQAAIDAAGTNSPTGGAVYIPTGYFRCESQLAVPYQGVQIYGDGRYGSRIHAVHTDPAIINLKGGVHCTLNGLQLTSDSTTYPDTGILLGRSSANGAGFHEITNITMEIYVGEAGIYSIASEENLFSNIWVRMFAGKYGFYTAASDILSIDSLTASTNTVNKVERLTVYFDSLPFVSGATPLYIDLGNTKLWNFDSCYLTLNGNYYIVFNADTDADAQLVFTNTNGEPNGVAINYGGVQFKSNNATAKTISRIQFSDTTFDLIAAGRKSVSVESGSGITLNKFKYEDYRTGGAAGAHNQTYIGLIDSFVGTAEGEIEVTEKCWNNTIIADIRNNIVRATSATPADISGNTITQYSYIGMPNQGTTTQTSSTGPMVVIPKPGGGAMPLQKSVDDAEIMPSNVVFTNTGDTGAANYELPKATLGNRVMFVKIAQQNIRLGVKTSSGDLIYNTSSSGFTFLKNTAAAPEGYVFMELLCVTPGSWMPIGSSGTWTFTNTP
jgi:hypothetical protein